MHRFVLVAVLFSALLPTPLTADDFPQPINTEPLSEQDWLSPEKASKAIRLPPGFRAVPFAAEPDVQNPIAMAWDGRGRLWIAENYTYAERKQKFQLDLRDRVVIFDNTEGDRFRKRTVFTDDVQMLTSVEVGHGGVWLMCPPRLIFIPDENGDDIPDSAGEVVLDGFTVAKQNYHNFANGLRFGPDGWLYGRCGGSCPGRIGVPGTPDEQRLAMEGGMWRYHPATKSVEVLTTGTTNPWGHDWNSVGEGFFVNTVNGHLWHLIPGAHFTRPFTLDPNPLTYELIDFHADHWHFDTGQSWNKSRDGVANSYGGGHAHSGTMIYQGTRWPKKYHDKLFTLNLHGRRANQERLERTGGGYVARHEEDFFIAGDPWFRGMDMSVGPDGNVFVIDWSDTGECHESTGVHRTSGRIFKIIYGDGPSDPQATPNVQELSNEQLARMALSPEAWSFRQAKLELARRYLARRNVDDATELLKQSFARPDQSSSNLIRSLLALHVCGATDASFLNALLDHQDEHVRAWTIRLLSEEWPIDDAIGPAPLTDIQWERRQTEIWEIHQTMLTRMAVSDSSALVRLTLASMLQRIPVSLRPGLASMLGSHGEDRADHNIPLMIWYGLMASGTEHMDGLVVVAGNCKIPTTQRLIARRLAAQVEANPRAVDRLISFAATTDDAKVRANIIDGIHEGWQGWRKVPKPATWSRLKNQPLTASTATKVQQLEVLFGEGRSLDEVTAIALGQTSASYSVRMSALETLIQVEPDDLMTICKKLLSDPRMNVLAVQGLAKFDNPEAARLLVSRYGNVRAPYRPQVMSILVSRVSFAKIMLAAMAEGKIPRDDLSAYQVRQMQAFVDPSLNELIGEVWGEVRQSSNEKRTSIDRWKVQLESESSATDLGNGRKLFAKNCQSCHRLYGEGEQVGPDLTGGQRDNLDYLLHNIVDPSAVVDKDYRMTKLLTEDGRLITGLVTAETERTITIRTATESLVFDKQSIESQEITDKSPMPDGLLDTLSHQQVHDLISYLRHPTQVEIAE